MEPKSKGTGVTGEVTIKFTKKAGTAIAAGQTIVVTFPEGFMGSDVVPTSVTSMSGIGGTPSQLGATKIDADRKLILTLNDITSPASTSNIEIVVKDIKNPDPARTRTGVFTVKVASFAPVDAPGVSITGMIPTIRYVSPFISAFVGSGNSSCVLYKTVWFSMDQLTLSWAPRALRPP